MRYMGSIDQCGPTQGQLESAGVGGAWPEGGSGSGSGVWTRQAARAYIYRSPSLAGESVLCAHLNRQVGSHSSSSHCGSLSLGLGLFRQVTYYHGSCTRGCCCAFVVHSYFTCNVVFLNLILVYTSLTRHQFDVVFYTGKFTQCTW